MWKLSYAIVFIGFISGFSGFAEDETQAEQKVQSFEKKDIIEFQEIGGFPLCDEVFMQKRRENIALIQKALGPDSEALNLFNEGTYFYPSDQLIIDSDIRATEEERMNQRAPLYFEGATELLRLVPGEDVNRIAKELGLQPFGMSEGETKGAQRTTDSSESVKVSEIQKGDLVLSTTSVIISDPRYQKDCWGRVDLVFEKEVPEGTQLGAILYEPKDSLWQQEKTNQKVFVLQPPHIYTRKSAEEKFKDMICSSIRAGRQLKSPLDLDDKSVCTFGSYDAKAKSTETQASFYNLKIRQTGAYYIGPIGGEVLVHN